MRHSRDEKHRNGNNAQEKQRHDHNQGNQRTMAMDIQDRQFDLIKIFEAIALMRASENVTSSMLLDPFGSYNAVFAADNDQAVSAIIPDAANDKQLAKLKAISEIQGGVQVETILLQLNTHHVRTMPNGRGDWSTWLRARTHELDNDEDGYCRRTSNTVKSLLVIEGDVVHRDKYITILKYQSGTKDGQDEHNITEDPSGRRYIWAFPKQGTKALQYIMQKVSFVSEKENSTFKGTPVYKQSHYSVRRSRNVNSPTVLQCVSQYALSLKSQPLDMQNHTELCTSSVRKHEKPCIRHILHIYIYMHEHTCMHACAGATAQAWTKARSLRNRDCVPS
jgi:hypothetical protein